MRRIAVFTGTRAEYGLLHWLMRDIQAHPELELQVIAGAMHYAPEFGETWKAIVEDGFHIDAPIDMLLASDSVVGVTKSMGLGTIAMADALARLQPDALVLLGDRFEALAAAQAALIAKVPIVHLHGGELTEGAYDDAIRHAITKMASWHAVAAEPYRRRVIQMGESPDRVMTVGALGIDNLLRTERPSRDALMDSLDWPSDQAYFLVTYHPVTLANEPPQATMKAILNTLDAYPDQGVLLTYPNADNGGRALIDLLKAYSASQPDRVRLVPSLGHRRYPAALAGATAVVGNSSSGLIEAPALGVPTVNIGQRQTGRLAAPSVMQAEATGAAISAAVQRVMQPDFRKMCRAEDNPYGQGQASQSIVNALAQMTLNPIKTFYDLPVGGVDV
ncbi:UDP-N-acetylglucosamine 2-epimerase [Saccharospirillum mangrovi]|uniref:UDP-N-acetylglucosamine 2-epimerase n=1 Tax=Saccharospirillum mangrovi TaxID=2161747 RepID=UPI000D3D9BE1|nr:UDP-N-acetylglucosamine 2-epimerase [Saccharospirillum mangrovi]